MIQPLWKVAWRFLKNLGIKPPYDPAIPLPGIHPEETKTEKYTCIPLFIAALFTIARTWKQPIVFDMIVIVFFISFPDIFLLVCRIGGINPT